ncbi:neuroglobin-like [Actinia tenebrosa]|uniref:Globin-like protein n=1 Tax=Actinia tenebrosa TaxID=6105 RepID=A0A2K9UYQ2_ACTTE|nr:neuroglobin-like [Actinia tenebrosa]XP_031556224.1 neuroglobin-like [Actinia tenebrosa]XP_031556225.1 neuroglobin-like [Actinia tenebrosa]XP_031556226.1 neuroglobin-like [Actinia tenebrosa]XP_031556227.1 neuroglobin-like [Actinia tenebrosa]AUV50080.1 globin-like protein [Actinia tenebrosa]
MGCGASVAVNGHVLSGTSCTSVAFQPIPLSEEQKKLIYQTWSLVEPVKVAAGRKLFARLFELNPNLQSTFPAFKGLELKDILNSRSLYLHAKRVMNAMENAVSSLNDSETFTCYLANLGDRHLPWNIQRQHFDIVGECLLWTLQDMLGPACTTDVAQAWAELFGYITESMLSGIDRAKANR